MLRYLKNKGVIEYVKKIFQYILNIHTNFKISKVSLLVFNQKFISNTNQSVLCNAVEMAFENNFIYFVFLFYVTFENKVLLSLLLQGK